MKRCSVCQLDLPYSEFTEDKRAADGLRYCCRSCHRVRMRIYMAKRIAEDPEFKRKHRASVAKAVAHKRATNDAWREADNAKKREYYKERRKLRREDPEYRGKERRVNKAWRDRVKQRGLDRDQPPEV